MKHSKIDRLLATLVLFAVALGALFVLAAPSVTSGGGGVSSVTATGYVVNNGTATAPILDVDAGGPLLVATPAALTFYVDPTGNDSNPCTSSGASACLTIQAAINKAPKMLRHQVTVNVAAGSYKGFYVSGFTMDPSVQQSNGGILIDGTISNSTTLATGTATGTATSGSTGSGVTFGVLNDTGQAWTVNDLRGRFVTITAGTGAGQFFVIDTNTATSLTVAGFFSAIDATSVYAIQDATSLITTAITGPPSPTAAGTANASNCYLYGNAPGVAVTIRGFSIQAAAKGITQSDATLLVPTRLQFRESLGGNNAILQSAGSINASLLYSVNVGTRNRVHYFSGATFAGGSISGQTISSSVFLGGNDGIQLQTVNTSSMNLFFDDFQDVGSGTPNLLNGVITIASRTGRPLVSVSAMRLSCHDANEKATLQGFANPDIPIIGGGGAVFGSSMLTISGLDIGTACGIGFGVLGHATLYFSPGNTTSGSAQKLFYLTAGGQAQMNLGGSFTATSTVTDIVLDDGAATSTMAAVAASSCFSTLGWGSAWCKF